MNHIQKLYLILLFLMLTSFIAGCQRSSDRVAHNLDIDAEEFRLTRRIVAINGITDKPLFEIVGKCSIETGSSYVAGTMEIICKTADGKFNKNFVYLSDNVLIFVDQLDNVNVPQYHYQIVFAPQSILPIPQIVGGGWGQ